MNKEAVNGSIIMEDKLEGEGSFFRKQSLAIKDNLKQEEYNNFCNINNDEDRVKFIYGIKNIELPKSPFTKSIENSTNLKNQGNANFGKQYYQKAIQLYNNALIECPKSDEILLSTIYANRSAAYYYLQFYKYALQDISICLTLQYPENLHHKVLERKARCFLALNEFKHAISSFKEAMPALLKSNLETNARLKKESDFSVMIALLTKTLSEGAPKKKPDASKQNLPFVPNLSKAKNNQYPSASNLVKFENKSVEGRFAVANTDIEPGEVILVEDAHCANLLYGYSKTHCQNCFIRVSSYLLPCSNCPNVVFCSLKCKQHAMNTYHKYECEFLGALWVSGTSVICNLSVRLLTQKGLDYFLQIKSKLNEEINNKEKYDSNDYRRVYNLCSHKDKRTHLDFFQRSVMAVVLLKYLQQSNFFNTKSSNNLTDDELYIGGLLLHNLQVLQFNAHEIAELQFDAKFPGDIEHAKSQFIGGGLFSTVALFNHSCEPGIVRYFSGSKMIVRSVKPIPAGEIIAENYGPIYTQMPRDDRRAQLKDRYWFDCNCKPCTENWPVFENMKTDVLPFRCLKSRTCPGSAIIDINTDDFMFPCSACGEQISIFGSLKGLNETEAMFKRGERFMKNQLYNDALEVFIKIMKLLDNTLKAPYKDFCLCQQKIRSAMLTFGNMYQPLPINK